MNVITQFFKTDINTINSFINNIKKVHNIDRVMIFTDTDINTNDRSIVIYKRRTKLKWKDVFKFIYDHDFLNNGGCFIIDPNTNLNSVKFNLQPTGVNIENGYIFCKDLKKVYNINRHIFSNYEFLKRNMNGSKIKVASIVHIYYEDLIEEIISYQKNLLKMDIDVNFYFCLVEDSSTLSQKIWITNKLKSEFPNCDVSIYPNKGLDIGSFLLTLKKINNKNYDYIVKTHTKKSIKTSGKYFGEKWRRSLMSILNESNLDKVYKLLENETDMIGSNKWKIHYDNFNKRYTDQLINELNIPNDQRFFIGGTMFWIKYKCISKHLDTSKIEYYYDLLEEGYFSQVSNNDNEYLTHSFERIFGFMCKKIDVV